MIATQQPVTQYVPPAHGVLALHTAPPFEHVCPLGTDPSTAAPPSTAQSAGIDVFPMQSSQRPQGFVQSGTWVHGVHLVGSSSVADEHVDERRTVVWVPSGF